MFMLPGPPLGTRGPVLEGIVLAWRDGRWVPVAVAGAGGSPTTDRRSSSAYRPVNPWSS